LAYDVGLGADERRGPDTDLTPFEVKQQLVPLLERLDATGGLSAGGSYAVGSLTRFSGHGGCGDHAAVAACL
jgi:hypothetical protein